MATIGKLFGRSPFNLLQRHMDQVAKCVARMAEAVEAYRSGQFDRIAPLASETSSLEHQADQIRDDVRTHVLRRFFMPVDRSQVLRMLNQQDLLADTAEDVCVLLTMKSMTIPVQLAENFGRFIELNLKAVNLAASIVDELDELVESGFGGAEAEKIRSMAHDVAFTEHQADVVAHELVRSIFDMDKELSTGEFHLWMRLTQTLSTLSNTAEQLAETITMVLSLK